MRFYRIQDEYTAQINSMLKGEVESVKVLVQGFKGSLEITKQAMITKLGEVSLDKPCFIASGSQIFENIDSFDVNCVKDSDLRKSRDNNEFIECKYNGSKALYNAKTHVCKVVFEGILYNFEKISSVKQDENK